MIYKSNGNENSFNKEQYDIDFDNMEEVELMSKLKKEMLKASKELQCEKAAFLRDEMQNIEGNKLA